MAKERDKRLVIASDKLVSASASAHLLALRKKKNLHTVVENKLIEVLRWVAPDFHAVPELFCRAP